MWEKQLAELEARQSRGDQLTDAEKNKLKKLKKKSKEKEKKERNIANLSNRPKVSAAVLRMQENLRLRDEAAAADAAAAAAEEARIKAEEEAESQRKADEDAKKAAKKEKERLKKEQLRAEGKLLSAKQKEEQKRLEAMRAQLLANSNISCALDHTSTKRSIGDDKKKKKAMAEKRRQEAEATRQAAETVTTVASKHLAKTFDAEGVVIADESDEAEDDWDAVDNLDDLVKISGKIQANHELQEEAEQMAMEDSRQEPNIKDNPIRSAATPRSHKMSTAPTDGKVDDKIFHATVLRGQPSAHQNSGDSDTDSGNEESAESSDSPSHSNAASGSEDSSDLSSSDYSSSDEYSDSDEDHEFQTRIATARTARLMRFEVEKNKRSKDRLRCPIICIMGHVDTGKTKILDNIRRTNVQDAEAGGITQQIGATFVPDSSLKDRTLALNKGKFDIKVPGILVIDTPGHESFTNLRSRGSSLCDMAILVVDIMHGLEPQTLESLNMLRMRKTPFIIALNKIDRMYDWKAQTNAAARDSLADQKQHSRSEFEDRARKIMLEFAKEGLNAALYWENPDVRTFINVVPTSAITGEGIPDLLHTLVSLTQTRLNVQLQFFNAVQCTVLEVKMIEGLGTTMDVILINGTLNEGQTIVVAGLEGAIVTTVRALLTPQPLREIRVKANYQHHKEISAAMGIKIVAQGLEKAVAGTSLLVQNPEDDLDELKEEVLSDMKNVLARVDKSGEGVYVQASTLGSLEALLEFLKSPAVNIPVAGIAIGPVNKRDVMGASVMHERKCPEFATILAFDVKVTEEAYKMAAELNVKVMTADIIYHLFDQFTAFLEEIKQKKREEAAERVSFPCVLKIMPNCIFNKRDPIVVGVDVLKGIARVGTQLCIPSQGFIDIGKIASMEHNHKQVEKALPGQSVAMKIQAVSSAESSRLYGRHFDHKDELVSRITRESIDMLKDNFRDELTKDDWRLVVELKKKFEIFYGEPM
uniref:Eukaryotic translation initiation factor 5B n=1 Tax=Micromonas pusilla TaxID=38833 RepID=A0A7S0PNH4_MICPS